eukprot:Nk52_evm26s356 gene=Nk52_evmTU26s356
MSKEFRTAMRAPPPPSSSSSAAAGGGPGAGFRRKSRKRSFSPTPWRDYFDEQRSVEVEDGDGAFNVYVKESPPIGSEEQGGRVGSGAESSTGYTVHPRVAAQNDSRRRKEKACVVMLHGGGHSALSWAVMTGELVNLCNCKIVAIDLRGHGSSRTLDESDFSLATLTNDVVGIVEQMATWSEADEELCENIVLVGHSMGGSVAVNTALHERMAKRVSGLVVLDVVEGTAVESLSSMRSFLSGRPSRFNSVEHAIEWSLKSGQIRNHNSAKVSMPGQIMPEDEANKEQGQTWRIDLLRTEPFWVEWFENLSQKFLSVSKNVPKLLILAGVDRLDKDMTVGQMRGEFQMYVVKKSGHMVHEDAPEEVAGTLAEFLVRNMLSKGSAKYKKQAPGAWGPLAAAPMGPAGGRLPF